MTLGRPLAQTFGRDARDRRAEAARPGLAGAHAALETFYFAFNARSLEALGSVWAPDASASLANPVGGLLLGGEPILALYRRLFEGPARIWVELHEITEYADVGAVLFLGRERGEFSSGAATVPLAIRTTRWFRHLGAHGWRQVHHHGSVDDPALLDRYQRAVRGEPSPRPA